jgi:hypothetical protein
MKLRASFVHVHRAAVKHRSVQGRNGAQGFSRLRHLHERDAPRFARIPVLHDGDGFDGTVGCKQFPQLLLRHRDIQVSDKDVSHEFIPLLTCPKSRDQERTRNFQKAILMQIAFRKDAVSERLYVFSLPALGPLRHIELHSLPFLQALEAACLDRREVYKNIFATLAADETIALRVVEPLHCSLFCHMDTVFL